MGLADLRAAGEKVGASPASAIATLLLGVVLGGTGFLNYAERTASRNNDLMLEAAAKGDDVSSAMPVSATMLSSFAFALGTPLGWLATYLTVTGLVRSVAAAAGERARDPLVALISDGWSRATRRRDDARETRRREALEGPEVADRLASPDRFGIEGADFVLVASRRKLDWTPGTVLDCDGRYFRVGEPMDRELAVGLRTLYPLTEAREAEVFRRVVRYALPSR